MMNLWDLSTGRGIVAGSFVATGGTVTIYRQWSVKTDRPRLQWSLLPWRMSRRPASSKSSHISSPMRPNTKGIIVMEGRYIPQTWPVYGEGVVRGREGSGLGRAPGRPGVEGTIAHIRRHASEYLKDNWAQATGHWWGFLPPYPGRGGNLDKLMLGTIQKGAKSGEAELSPYLPCPKP